MGKRQPWDRSASGHSLWQYSRVRVPRAPPSGKGKARVARRAYAYLHVYTHIHTRARAHTLHIHTACFLRSPYPGGRGLFLFKEQTVSAQTQAL